MDKRVEYAACAAAFVAGLAAAAGQVLVIREALALWSGFELAAGLVLAAWLLFAGSGGALGGAVFKSPGSGFRVLPWAMSCMALFLPAAVLAVRAARPVAGLGPGELPGLDVLLCVAFAGPAPAAGCAGFLFAAAWSAMLSQASKAPQYVYVLEALGGAAGGLLLAVVLLPRMEALQACLAASALLAATGAACALAIRRRWLPLGVCLLACVLGLAGLILSGPMERASRRWQWGADLAVVRDTPYQNLALLRREGLHSLFGDGVWLFSLPDPNTAEPAAHLPLLEHPAPRRVLVLEGDPYGMAAEVLRHPGVQRADFVLRDPGVLEMITAPPPADPRFSLHVEDPAVFVRTPGPQYDVVILAAGDALSVGANRLCSVEFFRELGKRLAPGGLLALAVSGPARSPGPAKLAQLRSMAATLRAVFPHVLAAPGESARFFAGGGSTTLIGSAGPLLERMESRGLRLDYVRPDTLANLFSPLAMDYLDRALAGGGRVNTDDRPAAYLHALALQAMAASPDLADVMLAAARIPAGAWRWMSGLSALIVLTATLSRSRKRTIPAATAVAGGCLMVFELALLVDCQTLLGALYSRLALLIAVFMAGLAAGGLAAIKRTRRREGRALLAVHLGVACLLTGLGFAPPLLRGHPAVAEGVLYVLGFLGGGLGGVHYGLAAESLARGPRPSAAVGAGLYALDLAGALVFSTAASLFLVPVFGVRETLWGLSLVCLACAPGLWLSLREGA